MANTKKKNVEAENIEEVSTEQVEKVVVKKAPRKFAANDMIPCRSVTYGELLYPAKKSQMLYTWADCGDITEVEFQDLQALRSTKSQYLNKPLFIIEDEELLKQWPEFKALYEKIAAVDVDHLFDMPIAKFKNAIKNIPNGYKTAVKNIASVKILDGTLDSIQKIKALDEVLGTDLMFYVQ